MPSSIPVEGEAESSKSCMINYAVGAGPKHLQTTTKMFGDRNIVCVCVHIQVLPDAGFIPV